MSPWKRLAAAALVLTAAACNDSTSGTKSCESNRDCDLPAICQAGACIVECRRNLDCANGRVCVESVCRSSHDPCASDEDCAPFGLVCDHGESRCVEFGTGAVCDPLDNPCPVGQDCVLGRCAVAVTDGDPSRDARPARDLGVVDADRPPRDAAPDAERPRRDAAPDLDAERPDRDADRPRPDAGPGPDAAPGDGRYGDPCLRGADCQSTLCVDNKMRGIRVCTSFCASDPDCPGRDTCLQVQTGEHVCYPNETGYPCDVPANCTAGICLTPPQPAAFVVPHGVCSANCPDDSKCPPGFTCQQVPGANGRVCAPNIVVHPCPDNTINGCGGTCPGVAPELEANVTFCLSVDASGGYCSCSCHTAADCPVGFSCAAGILDTGDGNRPGICLPLAGYVCPDEANAARANPPYECPSLSCAGDPENPNASLCTSPCTGNADCPLYACTQIGGDRGCLPAN